MAGKRGRPRKNKAENQMIRALDRIRVLEEFESLLPIKDLREDIKKGLSADEIYKKYEHIAAARVAAIALAETNSSIALAAAKEMRDRATGKATEKKEITHKLGNLPDEELDAYLLTKLKDHEIIQESSDED